MRYLAVDGLLSLLLLTKKYCKKPGLIITLNVRLNYIHLKPTQLTYRIDQERSNYFLNHYSPLYTVRDRINCMF